MCQFVCGSLDTRGSKIFLRTSLQVRRVKNKQRSIVCARATEVHRVGISAIAVNYKTKFLNLMVIILVGIAVAAMMIPQALAYAVLAGLPPVVGLYTAIVYYKHTISNIFSFHYQSISFWELPSNFR
jgi:hypothetical protein